jgi:NAD-dependent deacetylase
VEEADVRNSCADRAGVSKASGVPTFVEMGDLRDKLSREYFNAHPHEFYRILN